MRILLFGIIITFLYSCGGGSSFDRKVKALGSPNQLTVICDEEVWSEMLGDSLTYYLESVYPVLPRPEPLYDVKTFTPYDLRVEGLRKELRTYLLCASAENPNSESYQLIKKHLGEKADFTKVGLRQLKDQWAAGQVLLYFTAPTDSALAVGLAEYLPVIVEQVKKQDYTPTRSKAFLSGVGHRLTNKVDSAFQVKMSVPSDYVLAEQKEDFMWLRKDWEDITANIFIHQVPYVSEEQIDPTFVKSLRDSLGARYVKSNTEGSVMRVNDTNLPLYSLQRKIDDRYTLQVKGLWEMSDDFMGGPFVSYLIVRENERKLLFVDAFILAPGRAKRNLMQEMEVIIEDMNL